MLGPCAPRLVSPSRLFNIAVRQQQGPIAVRHWLFQRAHGGLLGRLFSICSTGSRQPQGAAPSLNGAAALVEGAGQAAVATAEAGPKETPQERDRRLARSRSAINRDKKRNQVENPGEAKRRREKEAERGRRRRREAKKAKEAKVEAPASASRES